MHFAGVCTEPDPRQAAVRSNFGISLSAAAVISNPLTSAVATRKTLKRNMISSPGQSPLKPEEMSSAAFTIQVQHPSLMQVNHRDVQSRTPRSIGNVHRFAAATANFRVSCRIGIGQQLPVLFNSVPSRSRPRREIADARILHDPLIERDKRLIKQRQRPRVVRTGILARR